jgi:hypothetical protein
LLRNLWVLKGMNKQRLNFFDGLVGVILWPISAYEFEALKRISKFGCFKCTK